jgi:hypothetical protein
MHTNRALEALSQRATLAHRMGGSMQLSHYPTDCGHVDLCARSPTHPPIEPLIPHTCDRYVFVPTSTDEPAEEREMTYTEDTIVQTPALPPTASQAPSVQRNATPAPITITITHALNFAVPHTTPHHTTPHRLHATSGHRRSSVAQKLSKSTTGASHPKCRQSSSSRC